MIAMSITTVMVMAEVIATFILAVTFGCEISMTSR